jgi:hypothetical protein
LNALGIDSKNLEFDFRRDWLFFQDSRVKKFLVCWLQKELNEAHRVLENVVPADLGKAQGTVAQIKKMLNLVEKKFCDESLKEVLTYLDAEER